MNSQRYEGLLKQMKPGSFVHQTLSENGQREAARVAEILNAKRERDREFAQLQADRMTAAAEEDRKRETPLEVARVYMGCMSCRAQMIRSPGNPKPIIDDSKI